MQKVIRAMMIGAHCDDCDFCYGGLALKYAQAGHQVKFLSLCNGCGGHHELPPDAIAKRRRLETLEVARLAGVEYAVWEDIPDCELMADLETRKRLIREIREFKPDVIFAHRPNDYHADHRNAAILVQDASYLLIVPNFCSDTPALPKMPVIFYSWDEFQNPPFDPDVVIGIDDVVDDKFKLMDCHVSQVYEWLPWTHGKLAEVPLDPAERLSWLHGTRVDRNAPPNDEAIISTPLESNQCEQREALIASLYRSKLIDRYGEEGRNIHFAEAFELCAYGAPLTPEAAQVLFPF